MMVCGSEKLDSKHGATAAPATAFAGQQEPAVRVPVPAAELAAIMPNCSRPFSKPPKSSASCVRRANLLEMIWRSPEKFFRYAISQVTFSRCSESVQPLPSRWETSPGRA